MPMNEYVKSDEYVFIQYHDVIKSYKPKLLSHMLYSEYRKGYDGCIDFERFKDYSDKQLLDLVINSTDMNILQYLKISEFNADLCLYDIKNNISGLYRESKLLDIGTSLKMMLKESYVKKIYIYTPEKDIRIQHDLEESFAELDKIIYVVGDCKEVIKQCPNKITTFILNDVTLVDDLIEMNKISYTTVLFANCGWNYNIMPDGIRNIKVDDLDNKMKKYIFKCAAFNIVKR